MITTSEAITPRDEAAERAILGCFILWDRAFYDCHDIRVDDFFIDSNRRIYTAISRLYEQDISPNVITLANLLDAQKELSSIGGREYLCFLTENRPIKTSVRDYLAIIKEAAKRRRILELSARVTAAVMDGSLTSDDVASDWEDGMMRIVDDREVDEPSVRCHIIETLNEILHESTKGPGLSGITYGLRKLDVLTCGMQPGEVTVVGARSGVGKSSLMIQATVANCRAGVPCHIFSFEMSKGQINKRILSIVGQVPYRLIREPRLLDQESKAKLQYATEKIVDWPLLVHDRVELGLPQLVSLARMSIRRHKTRFIGVDYAQIVQGPGKDERSRVAAVSRSLTGMVKHEECSLMLASQLRKVDQQAYDRPPHISDLRETGQLENDAHVVLLPHRAWDMEQGRAATEGQIIIPKQRSGETGTINVNFDRDHVVFTA